MRKTMPAAVFPIDAHGGSLRGRHARNEDAFLVRPAGRSDAWSVFAVADGLGGHPEGHRASALAVTELGDLFVDGVAGDPSDPAERLVAGFERINERILAEGGPDDSGRGMATTLTAVAAAGARAGFAHTGDSRLYRVRGDEIERVSTDQNLAERMGREGAFGPQAYADGPLRHALYGYLGQPTTRIESGAIEPASDDVWILATDGVAEVVETEEWVERARAWTTARSFVEDVLRDIEARGPRDDATVVAYRWSRGA